MTNLSFLTFFEHFGSVIFCLHLCPALLFKPLKLPIQKMYYMGFQEFVLLIYKNFTVKQFNNFFVHFLNYFKHLIMATNQWL